MSYSRLAPLSLRLISRWCLARVQQEATEHEDEELASTRLSLEMGNADLQSSPCSSSSSGARQQQPLQAATSAAVPGYGPSKPRDMLTEEKELQVNMKIKTAGDCEIPVTGHFLLPHFFLYTASEKDMLCNQSKLLDATWYC